MRESIAGSVLGSKLDASLLCTAEVSKTIHLKVRSEVVGASRFELGPSAPELERVIPNIAPAGCYADLIFF